MLGCTKEMKTQQVKNSWRITDAVVSADVIDTRETISGCGAVVFDILRPEQNDVYFVDGILNSISLNENDDTMYFD